MPDRIGLKAKPPLSGQCRGKTTLKDCISEAALQEKIVDGLRWKRLKVLVTSRHRHKCEHCGEFSDKGDGCDEGVPDLLVARQDFPRWMWAGVEIKGPKTKVSDEQRVLEAEGRIVVCRSLEEAEAAIAEADRAIRAGDPFRVTEEESK